MCRKAFCGHIRVVGHRQRVGHVQDIETPGRERGGDLGGTRIFERACDVSDSRQALRSPIYLCADVHFHSSAGSYPGFRG